jgi:hypothetical protein
LVVVRSCHAFFHLAGFNRRPIDAEQLCTNYEFGAPLVSGCNPVFGWPRLSVRLADAPSARSLSWVLHWFSSFWFWRTVREINSLALAAPGIE